MENSVLKFLYYRIDAMQKEIEKLREIASSPKMPRMNLRIKNGNSAFYDKILEVTPLGLEGGLR